MVNELNKLLGLKNEIDNDFKSMLDFPKTLFAIDVVAFLVLLINDLINYIQFNRLLTFSLYALVGVICLCSIVLYIKIKMDFRKINFDVNEKINVEYEKFYKDAKEYNAIDDIYINLDENKLSRKLEFKCTQQEITPEMLKEFMTLNLQNKQDEIDRKKFPLDNWDFYQIYGLEKGYITYNKATLYMKFPLPGCENQLTDEDIDVISMYLNAIETLIKDNQVIREKVPTKKETKEEPKVRKNISVYDGVQRGMVDTEEDEIRKMLENDDRFKGKDLDKVLDVINKMKEEKK